MFGKIFKVIVKKRNQEQPTDLFTQNILFRSEGNNVNKSQNVLIRNDVIKKTHSSKLAFVFIISHICYKQ